MTVYVNRIRRAYLRRRSIRQMALVTAGFLLFLLLLGRIDYLDQQARARANGVQVADCR